MQRITSICSALPGGLDAKNCLFKAVRVLVNPDSEVMHGEYIVSRPGARNEHRVVYSGILGMTSMARYGGTRGRGDFPGHHRRGGRERG